MPLDHAVDEPLAVGLVGDVADDGIRVGDLLRQRLEALGTAGGQDRDSAGGADRARELRPEAGARAGDDHDTTIHRLHDVAPTCIERCLLLDPQEVDVHQVAQRPSAPSRARTPSASSPQRRWSKYASM